MPKFTPGPWAISHIKGTPALFIDGPDVPNARFSICQMTGRADNERDANARLIAAAPEMYEFVKNVAEYGYDYLPLIEEAQALLKNIDGE